MGITSWTLIWFTEVMEKVDLQTTHKNGRPFDLVDAEAFDQSLIKYIEKLPQDVEDSNFFMIYLRTSKLYPKHYWHTSWMFFNKFVFTPQTPVVVSQGTFGVGSAT